MWHWIKLYLRMEWHQKENVFSCLLFAFSLALILTSSLEVFLSTNRELVFTVSFIVASLVTIQILLARSLFYDLEDGMFEQIIISRQSIGQWFLAKSISLLFFCFLIAWMILGVSLILCGVPLNYIFHGPLLGIVLFILGGCIPLGIFLSLVLKFMKNNSLLFPILFYPLIFPLFLAGIEATMGVLGNDFKWEGEWLQWSLFLIALNLIYGAVSYLLFCEIAES